MRCLMVDDTAQKLSKIPFLPSYTVVALNTGEDPVVLQSSDAAAGTYATLATVPAGGAVEVTLNNDYVKLQAAGSLILLGN